jgi:glycosyltransferase involved in cell wall biosynthesis
MIIDRGPPADKGILSLLQWPSWKRSWKYVKTNPSSHGCVVSEKHRNFVHKKTGVSLSSITVLPAGVALERFKTNDGFQKLTLVYHGKLDRNRGVLALPKFLQKAEENGIDLCLKMIGDGDAFDSLEIMAQQYDNLEIRHSLAQDALAQLLSQCHIGLLPMPESGVWTLASPLKRSEYAASGLAILGIDHSGHRLEDGEVEWMKLLSQEQFLEEGTKWLQMLVNDNSKLEQLKLQARQYAEEHMSWNHSIDALEKVLKSIS